MTKNYKEVAGAQRTGIETAIYLFLFLLVPIFFALSTQIDAPLVDGFHEGEYLAAAPSMRDYHAGLTAFPVLVHGAMDFIPAMLAGMVGGENHLIVWTRLFNVLIVALGWIVYLDLARTLVRNHPQRSVVLGAFVAVFLVMTNAADIDPVHRQQSFLGVRDFFLVLSIWSAVRAAACTRIVAVLALQVLCAVFASLALYWSYDRGLMAGIWIVMLCFGFAWQGKYKNAITVLLAYTASLLLISGTAVLGTLAENIHNIAYWVQSSGDVWNLPLRGKILALPGALSMFCFAVLMLLFSAKWLLKNRAHHHAPHVLGLILMQAVFLSKLYSLPTFPASYYFIWPSIVLLVMIVPEQSWARNINDQLAHFWREGKGWRATTGGNKILLGAVAALTLSFFGNAVSQSVVTLRTAIKPPADLALLDTERYSFDGLAPQASSCVLLWTNEGVFSVLWKKPACTSYPYSVYISKKQEAQVLAQLVKNPPGLIVYDSPFWSTKIYFRDMTERLPAIDKFIKENYVFSKNRYGYVFATPKQK